jgi:L-ectoine synthase
MIIRTLDDLRGTKGEKDTPRWSSMRFLHTEDRMGFTMTDTWIKPGADQVIEYKNHLEACYCIEGDGTIEDLKTGKTHHLKAGTIYALDKHDRHRIRTTNGMRLICTFTPALVGGEEHRPDGSYAAAPKAAKPRRKAAGAKRKLAGRKKKAAKRPKRRAAKRRR